MIPPLSTEFKYKKFESKPIQKGLINLNRTRSFVGSGEASEALWKDIRKGIKLRNIINSKRLNEQNKIYCGTEAQKLVIQRHLGFKEIMPQSSQWVVHADEHTECWFCG